MLDVNRDASGILHYTVGVRSTNDTSAAKHGVKLRQGTVSGTSSSEGLYCTFQLDNTGKGGANATSAHPQDLSAYLGSDIFRLEAKVEGKGWEVGVPNAVAHAKFGESTEVKVAVRSGYGAADKATVKLTVTSESDKEVKAQKSCKVQA